MTEPCGALMLEIRCDLPADEPHDTHHAETQLPAEVNMMIAQLMDDLELARTKYSSSRRWSIVSLTCSLIAAASYVLLIATGFC